MLKIYIASSYLRTAVQAVLHTLDFSVVVLDSISEQGLEPGDEILSISFETPMRLGGILDWIVLRAQALRTGMAFMPETLFLAEGMFFVKKQIFVSSAGQSVRLTDRESDVLRALYHANQHLMAKADLLEQVWGYALGVETHTIETHLYRLRQKIERDAANPENILTTENGYRLVLSGMVE